MSAPLAVHVESNTAGPWRTQGWVPTWAYIPIKDARRNLVCSLYPDFDHGYTREDVEHNAKLIVRACNLVMAGKALTDARTAKVQARGEIAADADWGLSENEVAAARMMNALMVERDELLDQLRHVDHTLSVHGKVDADTGLHASIRASIAKGAA